jgi:DNA-binding CsgD family transcriptional regulator
MADHTSGESAATEQAAGGSVEVLIGRLLRDLATTGVMTYGDGAAGVEEVFLDVEVDGIRCLLIRCTPEPDRAGAHALSPREREIARMVAKGYANKTIASVLDISSWTVSSHLRRIYSKLGVGSRAAMVARLLEGRRDDPTPQRSEPAPAADGFAVSFLPPLERLPARRP